MINKTKLSEILAALKIAIDEAEGWYDDCRGLKESEKLESLAPCYAILKEFETFTNKDKQSIPDDGIVPTTENAYLLDIDCSPETNAAMAAAKKAMEGKPYGKKFNFSDN
jgi:hypothetical protein